MKVNWNKEYNLKAIYTIITVTICVLCARAIFSINSFSDKFNELISVFSPFITGAIIAYLLNFILKFYENSILKLENKFSKKRLRLISIILTYLTAFFALSMFTYFVLPQVADSIKGITNDIPTFVDKASQFLSTVMTELNINQDVYNVAITKWNEIVTYIVNLGASFLPIIGEFVKTTASGIWNSVLGIIISIYILADKESFVALGRKITFALFSKEFSRKTIELVRRSNFIFGKFISGKIIDSLIIGILTFVVLTIFKMPYTVLVSVIIGITNVIPFFGPFFGAIPSAIIILFVSPIKALWFILIIIIIQQIDGNIIGPKILGDSLGISAFWILFALLIAGKLFGIVGMIIGVPLFAVIYSIIKEFIEAKLENKGLPIETEKYLD